MGRKTAFALLSFGVIALAVGSIGLLFSSRQASKPDTLASAPINSPNSAPIVIVPAPASEVIPTPSPSAPQPAKTAHDLSAQDQAELAGQLLRSDDENIRQTAIGRIRDMSQNDVRNLALGWAQWAEPMLDAKQYDDVEKMSLQSILDRPFDVGVVEAAQRARVLALMAEEKYPEALKEAKSYYNIASLADSSEAIDFLEKILAKTADASIATGFQLQQIAAAQVNDASEPTTNPSGSNSNSPAETDAGSRGGILASITIDPAPYADKLTELQDHGGSRNTNLMGEGNLLLLSDKPAEAKGCFEAACKNSGKNAKRLREALEGVARSIRAMDGNVGQANAYVQSVRNSLAEAAAVLSASGSPTPGNLRTAAQVTPLATVSMMALPPLEQARERSEAADSASQVQLVSGFECSVPIDVTKLSATHFAVSMTTTFPDWFMFQIKGAAGKTIRIDFGGRNMRMDRWWSVNPVYTNASNLSAVDTYTSNGADGTEWTSAWNGPLLPSMDGQKWHYISNVWAERTDAISFVQRFESDNAYVAMRVPRPPSYNEAYLHQVASNPLAKVIEVGRSKQDRPLLLVKLGDGDEAAQRQKPCILVYADEHADEADAGWVAQGIIEYLLTDSIEAKNLRDRFTFLIIPMLDPDSTAASRHEGFIGTFINKYKTPESIAYANWFQAWVNAGNRLDMVFDFHNIQSAEGSHVDCALLEGEGPRGAASLSMHKLFAASLQDAGFSARPDPLQRGWSPIRLGGWLSHAYGPLTFIYEIDSQNSNRHLRLAELKGIGILLIRSANQFFSGEEGGKLLSLVNGRRDERKAQWGKLEATQTPEEDAIQSEFERSSGSTIPSLDRGSSVP